MGFAGKRYDVVIAGAGPAGSSLGLLLAKQGLKVAIADKAEFPRRKTCGGLVTNKAMGHMVRIFGPDVRTVLPVAVSEGCTLYYRDWLVSRARYPGPMYFIRRETADAWMLDRAREAGCEFMGGFAVARVDYGNAALFSADGRMIAGRLAVGADGASSVVRRVVFPSTWRPARMSVGLVAEVPRSAIPRPGLDLDSPSIVFGVTPGGYGWVFPLGEACSIGVGCGPRHRGSARRLNRWMHGWLGLGPEICPPVRGWFLPIGCHVARPGCGNWILVGDAAGFVDAVTGEGLGNAFASALLAARAVASRWPDTEAAAQAYAGECSRELLPGLRWSGFMHELLYPPVMMQALMVALKLRQGLTRSFLRQLSGDSDYPEFMGRLLMLKWGPGRAASVPHDPPRSRR